MVSALLRLCLLYLSSYPFFSSTHHHTISTRGFTRKSAAVTVGQQQHRSQQPPPNSTAAAHQTNASQARATAINNGATWSRAVTTTIYDLVISTGDHMPSLSSKTPIVLCTKGLGWIPSQYRRLALGQLALDEIDLSNAVNPRGVPR